MRSTVKPCSHPVEFGYTRIESGFPLFVAWPWPAGAPRLPRAIYSARNSALRSRQVRPPNLRLEFLGSRHEQTMPATDFGSSPPPPKSLHCKSCVPRNPWMSGKKWAYTLRAPQATQWTGNHEHRQLLYAVALAASFAAAQTKVSGTAQCPGNPRESHSIEVGDHPGHAYTIVKGACTWTKPFEIAGLKSKDDAAAEFSETDGNKARDRP